MKYDLAETTLCTRCVLPSTFPNISFDGEGVCNFCNRHKTLEKSEFETEQKKHFLEVMKANKGQQVYDAVCCYSGGKDSTYMLKIMVQDFGLNVLAYTLDNGFITDQSKENILKIVELLGVDHIFYKPAKKFMTRMYKQSIVGDLNHHRGAYKTRISDVCLSCISLVNTHAARLALQQKIPMIFGGFTKGQVPKAVIKNNYKFYKETFQNQKEHLRKNLGEDADRYFDLKDAEFDIYQMSPYLVFDVPETEILKGIKELGWVYPQNLDGCTSNCSLNAVGNLCHEKKYGFHPYALELSQLVRENLLTREEALQKLKTGVLNSHIQKVLKDLDMETVDLNSLCVE